MFKFTSKTLDAVPGLNLTLKAFIIVFLNKFCQYPPLPPKKILQDTYVIKLLCVITITVMYRAELRAARTRQMLHIMASPQVPFPQTTVC